MEVGIKTTHLVASELFLVLWLAGCANLPMDQDCRARLESEFKVLDADGHTKQYHRSPDFEYLLSAAVDDELVGDYQGCLNNLKMVRVVHQRPRTETRRDFDRLQDFSSWGGQDRSNQGSANDAVHHAAGHTHHHDH